MNTEELLKITNYLGTGKTEITPKEEALYLECLNMANLDLYNIASTGSAYITEKQEIFLNKEENTFDLPKNLFRISSVLASASQKLTSGFASDASLLQDKKYNILGKKLYTDTQYLSVKLNPNTESIEKYISVFFVPNPKLLRKSVHPDCKDIHTTDPVFPKPYHIFLAHGALYYFYFANKVFLDKMAYIKALWQEDKDILTKFKNNGW